MHISEFLSQDEYEVTTAEEKIVFTRLETEPDRITNDCLFFLLSGVFHDEKKYLPFVLSKRPAAVVLPFGTETESDVPVVFVKSVRRAYAFAACRFYGADHLPFSLVGVTGTNGKTTVATEIARVLEISGKKVGYIGTGMIRFCGKTLTDPFYGMTTPDPPLLYSSLKAMEKEGCDAVIMEVSSHALALEKVAPLRFTAAVFTGLSEEHLDFHGDMQTYFEAKAKLFANTDTAFINVDCTYGKRLYALCSCPKKGVSAFADSDVCATKVKSKGLSGTEFLYQEKDKIFPLSTPLPGDFQIMNTLLCASVLLSLGVSENEVRSACKTMPVIPGRMEKVSDAPAVYLDYAHTPASLETALNILYSNKIIGQNIILVFGCGGERDRNKRPIMAEIAEKYADYFYITSDNSRGENPIQIFKDIESGCRKDNHKCVYSRERAIAMAIENANDDDLVLIEGKGDEPYVRDKYGIHLYSERKTIENAAARRKGGAKLFHENPSFRPDCET